MKFEEEQWFVHECPDSHLGQFMILNQHGTTVCRPSYMGRDNASLISNSPALFKAVQGYMDTVNNALATYGDQVVAMAEVTKVMQNIKDEKFHGHPE